MTRLFSTDLFKLPAAPMGKVPTKSVAPASASPALRQSDAPPNTLAQCRHNPRRDGAADAVPAWSWLSSRETIGVAGAPTTAIEQVRTGGRSQAASKSSAPSDRTPQNAKRVIQVQSPKTEHHPGKESRALPLFPELLPYLNESYAADPEAVYVVDERYRKAAMGPAGWRNINLGTQMKRILGVAEVEVWPRIFHNLRSSRETELVETYPLPVVAAWMGHSVDVAVKHYCQVTDDHFARAAGTVEATGAGGEKTVQKAVQSATEMHRIAPRGRNLSNASEREPDPQRQAPRQVATKRDDGSSKPRKRKADGVGFEPTVRLPVRQFSRLLP